MNKKAQVAMETMLGFGIFLLLFIGVSSVVFNENSFQNTKTLEISKQEYCTKLSQAFFETKNSGVLWTGYADWNTYINKNEIFVNYSPNTPFEGVYCSTTDTNLSTMIIQGDINIEYSKSRGYLITQ
jgi:hypothetical protein